MDFSVELYALVPPAMSGQKYQTDKYEKRKHSDTIQFGFHLVTGTNIVLSENGLCAERRDPDITDGDSVVYGAKPFKQRGVFEVLITKHDENVLDWSIQVGVIMLPVETEIKQSDIPSDSALGENHCIWWRDEIYNRLSSVLIRKLSYGSENLCHLETYDRVGMRLEFDGVLSFFVNGMNQGVAVWGLNKKGYDVYPVIDVNGRCSAVKITKAGQYTKMEHSQMFHHNN